MKQNTTSIAGLLRRRTLLKATAGVAALGLTDVLLAPNALAAGGMVALVHTQAAGDNGPVDSMIAKLKQLAAEKDVPYRAIYAQDPATYETIFRTLGDAGAAVVISTFNEVTEPLKAVAVGRQFILTVRRQLPLRGGNSLSSSIFRQQLAEKDDELSRKRGTDSDGCIVETGAFPERSGAASRGYGGHGSISSQAPIGGRIGW